MSGNYFSSKKYRKLATVLLFAGLAVTFLPSISAAQTSDVVRVEEDWELVLDEPSQTKASPQFITVMSPYSNADGLYGLLTWNYREFPGFHSGGLQMQTWDGDDLVSYANFGSLKLNNVSEAVTWTQVMSTDGSTLSFQIKDGQSTSWSSFGGNNMKSSVTVGIPNLNSYSSDVSTGESMISYGANRILKLRIKQVRKYADDGSLISTDNTSRVIHEQVQN